MTSKLLIGASILGLASLGSFVLFQKDANDKAASLIDAKIANIEEKRPDINLAYDSVHVNLFSGSIHVKDVVVDVKGEQKVTSTINEVVVRDVIKDKRLSDIPVSVTLDLKGGTYGFGDYELFTMHMDPADKMLLDKVTHKVDSQIAGKADITMHYNYDIDAGTLFVSDAYDVQNAAYYASDLTLVGVPQVGSPEYELLIEAAQDPEAKGSMMMLMQAASTVGVKGYNLTVKDKGLSELLFHHLLEDENFREELVEADYPLNVAGAKGYMIDVLSNSGTKDELVAMGLPERNYSQILAVLNQENPDFTLSIMSLSDKGFTIADAVRIAMSERTDLLPRMISVDVKPN